VTYRIEVGNSGPNATSRPIVVLDPLPAGLDFLAAAGRGWTCTEGWVVACTYAAPLPVGESADFEVTARVTATLGTEVVNVASVPGGPGGGIVTDGASLTLPKPPDGGSGGSSGGGLADTGAHVGLAAWAVLLVVTGWAAVRLSHHRRQQG
jgi:hypothetical protein